MDVKPDGGAGELPIDPELGPLASGGSSKPDRPWDRQKSRLEKTLRAIKRSYSRNFDNPTARKAAGLIAAIGADTIVGAAIPVQRTYSVIRIGASAVNAKVRGKDVPAAVTETANKMNGWYADLKAVPGHVRDIGQTFAPNKTFKSQSDLPDDLKDCNLLKRTLEVDLQGFSDHSAAFEKYKRERIANSGGEIKEGDFYQFKRTMFTHDSIEQYAMDLAEKLTAIAEARGHNPDGGEPRMKVVLNTHSMGGLEAIQLAYLIKEHNLPLEITHVVFNGTPLEGSTAARLGVLLGGSKCARQMLPGSSFLEKGRLKNTQSFGKRAKNARAKLGQGQFKEAGQALRQDKSGEREGSIAEKAACLGNARILITGSNHDTMVSPKSAKGMNALRLINPENIERAPFQVGEGHISFVDSADNRARIADWMERKKAFQTGLPAGERDPSQAAPSDDVAKAGSPRHRKVTVQRLIPRHLQLRPGMSFGQQVEAYVDEIKEKPLEGQSMSDFFDKMEFLARLDELRLSYQESGDERLAESFSGVVDELTKHFGVDVATAKSISQVGKKEFKALKKLAAGRKIKVGESSYLKRGQEGNRFSVTINHLGEFFIHPKEVKHGTGGEKRVFTVLGFDPKGKYRGPYADLSVQSSELLPNFIFSTVESEDEVARECQDHEFGKHVAEPYMAKAGYTSQRDKIEGTKNRVIAKLYASDMQKVSMAGNTEEVIKGMKGAVRGLVAIHEKGLVHRDIKPANIFINHDGEGVVGDLGDAVRPGDIELMAGSIPYFAPELDADPPIQTRAQDVWAFGVSLWETLYSSGEGPSLFQGIEKASLTESKVREQLDKMPEPKSPEEKCAQDAIRACLKVDPVQRPTARHLIQILDGKAVDPGVRFKARKEAFEVYSDAVREQGLPKVIRGIQHGEAGFRVEVGRAIDPFLDQVERPSDPTLEAQANDNLEALEYFLGDEKGFSQFVEAAKPIVQRMSQVAEAHIEECLIDASLILRIPLPVGARLDKDHQIQLIQERLKEHPSEDVSALMDEIEVMSEFLEADRSFIDSFRTSGPQEERVGDVNSATGFFGLLTGHLQILKMNTEHYLQLPSE